MLVIFQVSLAVLLSVGGIINAAAEAMTPIGAVNAPLSMLSFYFIDHRRLFRVPFGVAAGLGLLAFIAAWMEYASGGIMGPLLAGSHLINYLGWIFLILPKEARHYSWLMALSILQVAVASVLTGDFWFGPAFVCYAFLGSWTLALFLVNRLVHPERLSPASASVAAAAGRPRLLVGDTWRGVARDVDRHFINARFVGSLFGLTLMALGISVLFFVFIPRVWLSSYSFSDDAPIAGRPLTGFTDRVRLGDLGEIAESHKTVMEVRCNHVPSRRPFDEADYATYYGVEPRFRGAALEIYEQGNWERLSNQNWGRRMDRFSNEATVSQSVALEPLNSPILPAFGNVLAVDGDDVGRHPLSNELLRGDRTQHNMKYTYIVMSDDHPPDTDGASRRLRSAADPQRLAFHLNYLNQLLAYPANLERVAELAKSRVAGVESPTEAARQLEAWLGSSGEFGYSLRLEVIDPTIDPVEDFLVNRRTGHCEYFASSLALMLRMVGIPSRVVTGFKGGVYSSTTRSFLVQELHAHAWVEAFLDGQWRELDPTPAARRDNVARIEGYQSFWDAWRNRANQLWQASTKLSKEDQEALIYEPIGKSLQATWTSIKELTQGNTSGLTRLWTFLRTPRLWFSWQGGMASFVLLSLLAALFWLGLKVRRLLSRFRNTAGRTGRERPRIDFYERFLKIAKSQGLRQSPTQTAREFVHGSLAALQRGLPGDGSFDWPDELVEKFYRVRFGAVPLNEGESLEIQRRLDALEAALKTTGEATA